jgi:hypothetical protein
MRSVRWSQSRCATGRSVTGRFAGSFHYRGNLHGLHAERRAEGFPMSRKESSHGLASKQRKWRWAKRERRVPAVRPSRARVLQWSTRGRRPRSEETSARRGFARRMSAREYGWNGTWGRKRDRRRYREPWRLTFHSRGAGCSEDTERAPWAEAAGAPAARLGASSASYGRNSATLRTQGVERAPIE